MSQTAVFTPQSPPTDPALRQPLEVASLLPRFGAYLIDAVILMVASWIVSFAALMVAAVVAVGANGGEGFSYSSDGSTAGGLLVLSLIYAFAFLPPLAYFTLLPASKGGFNGRTIGKRAVGLRVVNADGTRITAATARRRGLAFFGPTFGAIVLGTFIDGLAGTPLIFTGILATAAAIYSVTDFTFAPASSELRATLHDRAAKTVVVLASPAYREPTDQPAPITPRPRTGRLNLLNVVGGLYLLALIAGIAIVVAVGSSGATSEASSDDVSSLLEDFDSATADDDVTTDDDATDDSATESGQTVFTADAEPAAREVTRNPDAPSPSEAVAAAKSPEDAQRQSTGASVVIAKCLGEIRDYKSCGEGFLNDGFQPDVNVVGDLTENDQTTGRSVVLSTGDSYPGELAVLVFDRDDIGWGYRFVQETEEITAICLSYTRPGCEDTDAFADFVNDASAMRSVETMFRDAKVD